MRTHRKATSATAASTGTTRARKTLFGIACLCVLGLAAFLGTGAPSVGAAESFPGQGFLPDNRAWEMVSPPEKNGGEVVSNAYRTQAAANGNATRFASLQAYADAVGTGTMVEYIARRSSAPDPGDNGWSTHAITPAQESVTLGGIVASLHPQYEAALSDDLAHGVFRAWSPLTEEPIVASVENLYRRDDLLSPGPGAYGLLTACPLCGETPLLGFEKFSSPVVFGGASTDFGHTIFESGLNLAPGAAGAAHQKKLYEDVDGALRFVGVLPDGGSAPRSVAGRGLYHNPTSISLTQHPISTDGSRISFTVPAGSKAVAAPGDLYERIGGRATIKLNLSERETPEAPLSTAEYWDASPDHDHVVFSSTENLTDDPPTTASKLYLWDRADHDETQQVAVDAGSGTFTLSFNGVATAPIAFDAGAAALQAALEALKGPAPLEARLLAPGNVEVSGGPGSPGAPTPYEITFSGDFAGADVPELTADGAGLGGGSATVETTVPVHNLTFISPDEGEVDGLETPVIGAIGIGADGEHVYFLANGQLVAGAPGLGGEPGLYMWHAGEVTFIGKVESTNIADSLGHASLVITPKQTRLTPDGRHLLFGSKRGELLLSVHGGVDVDQKVRRQIYLYSAEGDELECVSCAPGGAPSPNAAFANYGAQRPNTGASGVVANPPRTLSEDGRYAFFTTAERLVPEDTNGVKDAYVFDSTTGERHLLSSGKSPYDSLFLEASPSGKDAFILTNEQLSRWDVDQAYDLYDARIGGGFPEPPLPPPACVGDACQPAPRELGESVPGSAGIAGPGDLREAGTPLARCNRAGRRAKALSGRARRARGPRARRLARRARRQSNRAKRCRARIRQRTDNNRRAGR